MHHFEKKDDKDTGTLRHICAFHYNEIKKNGLEPEYEDYITHEMWYNIPTPNDIVNV